MLRAPINNRPSFDDFEVLRGIMCAVPVSGLLWALLAALVILVAR